MAPVPQSGRSVAIRRVQQGADLLAVQIPDDRLVMLLQRNGMNLPGKLETRRQAILEISEKALDRSQTDIAGTDAVSSVRLEMVEEAEDQIRRQLLDRDGAGLDAETSGDMADQQHEAVGVARYGVTAGIAPARHVLAKEVADMGSQIGHYEFLPRWAASVVSATLRSRAGVACRYH